MVQCSAINKVVCADLPTMKRMCIYVDYANEGVRTSQILICDDQARIEAWWLRECLKRFGVKIVNLKISGVYGKRCFVFTDGSIHFRHYVNGGEGRIYSSDHFISADEIRTIVVQERALPWWMTQFKVERRSGESKVYEPGESKDDVKNFVGAVVKALDAPAPTQEALVRE